LDGGYKGNMLEYLRICMDECSYSLFKKNYSANPFIIISFNYIIPKLFHTESEEKEEVEVSKKNIVKTGIQKLMDEHRKQVENMDSEKVSFMEFITNFIYKTEQDYSIVDRMRYTQLVNISKSLKNIKDKEKNAEKVPIETVATKIGKKEGQSYGK
jgi:hypothetical protein